MNEPRYSMKAHQVIGAIAMSILSFGTMIPLFIVGWIAVVVSNNRGNGYQATNSVANWGTWGNLLFGLGWLIALILAFSHRNPAR